MLDYVCGQEGGRRGSGRSQEGSRGKSQEGGGGGGKREGG